MWTWIALAGLLLLAADARRGAPLPGDTTGMFMVHVLPQTVTRLIGLIGSDWTLIVLGAVAIFVLKATQRIVGLGAAVGFGLLAAWMTKAVVHRPRPFGEGLGFPSGHAMVSLLLVLVLSRSLWPTLALGQRAALVIVSGVILAAVAIGRVAPGLHWPSDVLGGWLLALIWTTWAIPVACPPFPERATGA